MSVNEPAASVIWRLSASVGTTLTGAGNSGNWQADTPLVPNAPSYRTPVDLRRCRNVALYVSVGAITSSPSLVVQLDGYDPAGNLYAALMATTAITAAGQAAPVMCGLDNATAPLLLPEWGRVSWTLTGGTVTGCEFSLIARY